jgi:hypothetical protein
VRHVRELLTSGQLDKFMALEASLPWIAFPGPFTGDDRGNLRKILFHGGLTSQSHFLGARSLLDSLAMLSGGGTTGMNIDRQALLSQLLSDLARPASITQGSGNHDCGGTAVGYLLCSQSPADYAHIVTELAEKGEMYISSFSEFEFGQRPNITSMTLKLSGVNPSSSQSLTQQIFAHTAVMASNHHDGVVAGPVDMIQSLMNKFLNTGLLGSEMDTLVSLVTGQKRDVMYVPNEADEGNFLDRLEAKFVAANAIREHAEAHKPLLANYQGHWVVVTGVFGQEPDTQVNLIDWSGKSTSMSLSQFVDGIDSLVYDPSVSSAPDFMHNPAWDDPGGGGSVKPMSNGGDD